MFDTMREEVVGKVEREVEREKGQVVERVEELAKGDSERWGGGGDGVQEGARHGAPGGTGWQAGGAGGAPQVSRNNGSWGAEVQGCRGAGVQGLTLHREVLQLITVNRGRVEDLVVTTADSFTRLVAVMARNSHDWLASLTYDFSGKCRWVAGSPHHADEPF